MMIKFGKIILDNSIYFNNHCYIVNMLFPSYFSLYVIARYKTQDILN